MIRFQYRELTESEVNKYDIAGEAMLPSKRKLMKTFLMSL